MFYCF